MVYNYRLEKPNPKETAEIKRKADTYESDQEKRQRELEKRLEAPSERESDGSSVAKANSFL